MQVTKRVADRTKGGRPYYMYKVTGWPTKVCMQWTRSFTDRPSYASMVEEVMLTMEQRSACDDPSAAHRRY